MGLNAYHVPVLLPSTDEDPLRIGDMDFPPGTLLTLSQAKVITKTKISGRKGTVKESSGFDDWQIGIEVTIIANDNKYGEDAMIPKLKEFRKLWQEKKSLKVFNMRLNALGIKSLVLEKINIPDNKTYYLEKIRIDASSDEEHTLDQQELKRKRDRVKKALKKNGNN